MPYRYYSTHRPVGPGTFPWPDWNKVVELHNFDSKTYCQEIGREAWGYVVYEKPVPDKMLRSYEMMARKRQYTVKVTAITTLTVEAKSEDEATEKACEIACEYDADEMDVEILKEGN